MRKYEWRTAIEDAMQDPEADWLDSTTIAVALALSTWAGWSESQPIWPSLEQVAQRARCSWRTAQRKVTLLAERGYLKQVQRGGRNPVTGERWASKYELTVPGGVWRQPIKAAPKVDLRVMHPQERFEWAVRNCPPDQEPLPWLNNKMRELDADA